MHNYPLVSLIIISYAQEEYIADCMQSLLQLSYPNMELFYLDDCSPDDTFRQAVRYEEAIRQKFCQVFFQRNEKNQGLISNLNRLVAKCRGNYVKFMAADDFLLEDSIEKMVVFLEENREHDMLYSNGWYGNAQTHFPLRETAGLTGLYTGEQPCGRGLFEKLYENDFIAAPTVMMRKETYERLGLYDADLGIEDWDYFLRIAGEGSIGYLDEATVMYRFTDTSLSHSEDPLRRINMQKSKLLILEKYKEKTDKSRRIMAMNYNASYRDALYIDQKEYFAFLRDYAKRNGLKRSLGNLLRCLLYRLHLLAFIQGKNKKKRA